jgi:Ner family transcriptional regulator
MPLQDTHPALIRAWVQMRGKTLTQVALEAGLPECSCRFALKHTHIAGELAIAACLGKTPQELWPARLARRESKPIARRRPAHRQKRRAA